MDWPAPNFTSADMISVAREFKHSLISRWAVPVPQIMGQRGHALTWLGLKPPAQPIWRILLPYNIGRTPVVLHGFERGVGYFEGSRPRSQPIGRTGQS